LFSIPSTINDGKTEFVLEADHIENSRAQVRENIFFFSLFEKKSALKSLHVGESGRNITEDFCLRETLDK